MMTEPPIDKMIEKVGCKYALTNVIAKRARILIAQDPDSLSNAKMKAISYAAKEIYDDKVVIVKE